jgi:hypothetical protein
MNEILRYTGKMQTYAMSRVLKRRTNAMYFSVQCDPLSNCAKQAREILLLLYKKKNDVVQNERIKEELWVILDHEKLLSKYNSSVLSVLTMEEVLRLMVKGNVDETLICYAEHVMDEMDKKYCRELDVKDINTQALILKHMGHGIELLKLQHMSKKTADACMI